MPQEKSSHHCQTGVYFFGGILPQQRTERVEPERKVGETGQEIWVLANRTRSPLAFRPVFYPHFTNGGEKQDERPQAGFATGANPSTGFSSLVDRHQHGPDNRPCVQPPSKRL